MDFEFDFMHYRKIAARISIGLVLLSIVSLAVNQVEWGLDFTGGSLVEVAYENPVDPEEIRGHLTEAGYTGHVVQYFGSDRDILVRIPPQKNFDSKENARLGDRVLESLKESSGQNIELRRSEFVGPAVGEELTNQGGIALCCFSIPVEICCRRSSCALPRRNDYTGDFLDRSLGLRFNRSCGTACRYWLLAE